MQVVTTVTVTDVVALQLIDSVGGVRKAVDYSRGDYLPDLSVPFDMSNLSLSGTSTLIMQNSNCNKCVCCESTMNVMTLLNSE